MPLETRALKRIPLTAAIVAAMLAIWGASAARSAGHDQPGNGTSIAHRNDSARINAPPPRAVGFTVEYFRSLGIDIREPRDVPEPPAPKKTHECESVEDSRLARRQPAPIAASASADSAHRMIARARTSDSTVRRAVPRIESRTS
jgi:hypothetical protein